MVFSGTNFVSVILSHEFVVGLLDYGIVDMLSKTNFLFAFVRERELRNGETLV